MNTYTVTFHYSIQVEAYDESDAENMAWSDLTENFGSISPKEFAATVENMGEDWANPDTITGSKVRCNQCMAAFPEDEIIVAGENEMCPQCGETGRLMDMGVQA